MISTIYKYRFIVALIFALGIFGCSKTDDTVNPPPSQTDPAKAKEQVSLGNQTLIPKLNSMISSQGNDTSTGEFTTAMGYYKQALTYDPNNLDAHFGYAATEVLNITNDQDIRALLRGNNLYAPLSMVFNRNLTGGGVISSVLPQSMLAGKQSAIIPSPVSFYGSMQKSASGHPFSFYQDLVETKLLPVLSDAITHLNKIAQNQSFAMYVTDPRGESQDSIRIDLTEVYLLLASMNYIDAVGSFVTAYNVDYNSTDSVAVLQAWQPSSSFLAFRSHGSQRMKDTKSGLLGMAGNIRSAITYFISQSPHPGVDLIRYNTNDLPELQKVIKGMDSVQYYFSHTYTVQTDKGPLTVDISKFFDNAIPNFKSKFPAYSAQAQRKWSYIYQPGGLIATYRFVGLLTWQATSFSAWTFPDPTFNGTFPGLTDSGFKTIADITANGWQQSETIDFNFGQ